MKLLKPKLLIIFFCLLTLMFLSNDFGIIDIEKTAIVTAVAIDLDGEEYNVSVQVAVPEATDSNTENQKALLSGKGETIGAAIKAIGNASGWFPKLSFCNLIILGNGFADQNVVETLDYFAKTLRVQDSAVVCLSEKSAKEAIDTSSPLDNISSFAIQKILLKNAGLDRDMSVSDIRTFTIGYYGRTSSSHMPILKTVSQTDGEDGGESQSGSSGGGSQGGGSQESSQFDNKGNTLYDLTSTALFRSGKLVGVLDTPLTFTFNMLKGNVSESILHLNPADDGINYSLTIFRNSPKIKLDFSDDSCTVKITLDVYCRIGDSKKTGTDSDYTNNHELIPAVKSAAERLVTERIIKLFNESKQSGCDLLDLDKLLYKHHNGKYNEFKDRLLTDSNLVVSVNFSSQK